MRPPRAKPAAAETGLLGLARTVTELAVGEPSPRVAVTTALAALAAAFHAGAPLPRALAQARIGAYGDKTRALALAWAHEQLRLGLAEIFDRARSAGELQADLPSEALAWITLAASEALADEPPQAAGDRIRLLAGWLTGHRAG